MPLKFKDYYKTLGITRRADREEIRKAFRRLARLYHPDINKRPGAEQMFKEINEAYEVLRDAEKRKQYDALGANWRAGQDFSPPPGWKQRRPDFEPREKKEEFEPESGKRRWGFSDFFHTLFDAGLGRFRNANDNGEMHREYVKSQRGPDVEAELEISLEEAYHGAKKSLELYMQETEPSGRVFVHRKRYEMKIPPGTRSGTRIRLRGQGGKGTGQGLAGDLYIRVRLAPHPVFKVREYDLESEIPVTPWEAVLGAQIQVPTMDEPVTVRLPAGTFSGKILSLKGKGLMKKRGGRGDLFAHIKIVVPLCLTPEERRLYMELARICRHNPRKEKT
ncbi:MAG: J domain-containing protein [Candidatus Omnitrophota bacterium]|jgi:curved DNA-binding protein|nr:MAG: J domain-containing protein [Candidatus Omnitrophota bacterium]